MELAVFPHPVTVTADKVRTRIAVGLRVDDEHRFADLGLERAFTGESTDLAVEYDMGRGERAHGLNRVAIAFRQRFVVFVIAVLVLRNVEVEFARSESTRLNSSHVRISYAVFCLKKKKN